VWLIPTENNTLRNLRKAKFKVPKTVTAWENTRKFGNTLLEGVFIRLAWHLHNHDMSWIWNRVYACLWQLSLSVFHSIMTLFKMLLWHIDINKYMITCQCLFHDKMKLNCHVVGFDIGCHKAIITVSWIFFMNSTTVIIIEFVIKEL